MLSEVKGAAHHYNDRSGQAGNVMIVADDVTAPDDADLRAVLANMEPRIADDDPGFHFRSGRFTVTVRPSRGGGVEALRAAATTLRGSHGQGQPVTLDT